MHKKGCVMTAKMGSSFVDLIDFTNVGKEALNTAPRKLFEDIMQLILNKFHNQSIELERLSLELDEMQTLPVADLDEFYDNILKEIDDLTLFKKRLDELKSTDPLFEKLHKQTEELLTNLNIYMDRMGQLEVRVLKNQKIA